MEKKWRKGVGARWIWGSPCAPLSRVFHGPRSAAAGPACQVRGGCLPPETPSPSEDPTPIPGGVGAVLWAPLTCVPPPGSCVPALATVLRPTQAGSPGGSTASTSSPRYWEHWETPGEGKAGGSPRAPPRKVEMFGVTAAEHGTESEKLLDEFLGLQKEIFLELGLHYR